MAFEPGGRANKLGNRYEGRWVAKQLLRLLSEEILSVTIEAVGDDEKGVDLWIETKQGAREALQCKARNASKESWDISDLKARGVLEHLRFQLDRMPDHEFVFVSAVPAINLGDLCDSARNSNGPEDFYQFQVKRVGSTRLEMFRQFCIYLGIDIENQNDRSKAFNYLRRTRIELFPDNQTARDDLLRLAGFQFTGAPNTIITTLSAYAVDNDYLGKPIYADGLRKYLESQGITPKNLAGDPCNNPAIHQLQTQFEESIFEDLETLLKNEHRHPNNDDFEQGVYYRNPDLHEKVKENLEKERRCLIIGKPGTGKTALARGIGYEFLQENSCHRVFYLDMTSSQEKCVQWLKHIKQDDDVSALYIIDNCHNAAEEVNQFINRWYDITNARVLFVSRPLDNDLKGTREESYFDILKSRTVEILVDEKTTLNVIEGLEKREKQEQKEIGDIDRILKNCQGDLHLLNFYAEAWLNPKLGFERLSDVDEDAVLTDVYNKYLRGKPHQEELLAIAALSQFEILVEAQCVGKLGIIESIRREAWVEKITSNLAGGNIAYLKYFHSTPATYLIKAADKQGVLYKSRDEYILEKLEHYLASKPSNFFEVFFHLYKNGRIDLQWTLFGNEETFRLAKELIKKERLFDISSFLMGVWNWEERKTNGKTTQLLDIIKETINDNDWREFFQNESFYVVALTLNFFIKINRGFAIRILSLVDFKELGQRSQDVGLAAVRNFFQLTTQAGIEKSEINAFCAGLDFKELGQRSLEVGLSTVMRFIQLITQAGVDKSEINAFCAGLDFKELGQRSRDVGLSTVRMFLQLTTQAGIEKSEINAFCAGLDFKELGQRSRGVGLSTVMRFIQLITQAGVEKSEINAFCAGLDFKELGQRSRDVGLATIMTFIKLTTQARIEKSEINAFCAGLDFKDLGQRSREVGLATISVFLRLTTQAGIEKSEINDFCTALDWNKLGQEVMNKENGLRTYLFIIDLFIRVEGITKTMILQFIEGMGWEYLRLQIETNMSPDVLAATHELLTVKCELPDSELKRKGIDLRDANTWFRSFISNAAAGSSIGEFQKNIPLTYLKKAYRALKPQMSKSKLGSSIKDIKAWSIFIHNLCMIDRPYIEREIAPILRGYSAQQFEILFSQADLRDISTFFNNFNPRNGIFKWVLPGGINFHRIDFITKALKVQLGDIAHFLFNFYFIMQPDLCNHFAQLWDNRRQELLPAFANAGMKEIGFFLWNLWMAFPEGKPILLLADQLFLDILVEKASQEKKEPVNILGALGVLNLSGAEVPKELTVLIKPASARQICDKAARESPISLIRLLGGLMVLSPNIPSEMKNSYLNALKTINSELEISNQRYALARVTAWLESVDEMTP